MNIQHQKFAHFLLRFGVAFTFIYAGVSAFISPLPWIHYFPDFIKNNYTVDQLLYTWAVGEILLGVWLISGWRIFVPSILASIFLIGIFVFDFVSISILFRNVAILTTAMALAVLSNPWGRR